MAAWPMLTPSICFGRLSWQFRRTSRASTGRPAGAPPPPAARAELRRRRFCRINFVGLLAGRDAHDLDRHADHVSGALLASGTARHLQPAPSLWVSRLGALAPCLLDA